MTNKVLLRLRECRVETVTENEYAELIVEFINEVKREIEESWQWSFFKRRDQYHLNVSASNRYSLDFDLARDRLYKDENFNPIVYNLSDNCRIYPMTEAMFQRFQNVDGGTQTANYPSYYMITGNEIVFYPLLRNPIDIQIHTVRPQPELVLDDDTPEVSSWAIVLGAYARATHERGENNADNQQTADSAYRTAWNEAIQIDAQKLPQGLTLVQE